MKFHIVAVKDELTNAFLQPTYADDERAIIRIFDYQINNTPIWKDNPADFSLWHIGLFYQETGQIEPDLYKICSGTSVWRKEKDNDLQSVDTTDKAKNA